MKKSRRNRKAQPHLRSHSQAHTQAQGQGHTHPPDQQPSRVGPDPGPPVILRSFDDLLRLCPKAFRGWFESPGLHDPREIEDFRTECLHLALVHPDLARDGAAWSLIREKAHLQVETGRYRRAKAGLIALARPEALAALLGEARVPPDRVDALVAGILAGEASALAQVAQHLARVGLTLGMVDDRALERVLPLVERLDVIQRKVEERALKLKLLWIRQLEVALLRVLPVDGSFAVGAAGVPGSPGAPATAPARAKANDELHGSLSHGR